MTIPISSSFLDSAIMDTSFDATGLGRGTTSGRPSSVPRVDALRAATASLEDHLRTDSFPDLYELLKGGQAALKRGVNISNEEAPAWNFLKKDGFTPLPDYILQQYDTLQYRSFMGILPEINRVWITIDNRLFLWNYDTSEETEINTFDDQEQIIITVGLVKPVPGVFLEQIEYVLVVSTPIEIILLGVAFVSGSKKGQPRGEMTIYRTDMSIPSDGINMTCIVGTEQGRIFMRGNNGQLYEIQYQSREGWVTRKMRKINHSSSGLDLFIPTFLNWSGQDSIKFVTVDSKRQLLYTVSNDSAIEIISLGSDGKGFSRICKITDVLSQASRFADSSPQISLDERNFQIIAISIVPLIESSTIIMVAITSSGHRLYFSSGNDRYLSTTYDAQQKDYQNITRVRLAAVQGPPVLPGSSAQYNAMAGMKIHQGWYSQGFFLASQSVSDEVDRIIGVGIDSGVVTKSLPKFLAESASFVDIEGKTWAISQSDAFTYEDVQQVGFFLNDLSTQFEFPARKFHLLTNTGMTSIIKLRPVDLLLQLISSSQHQDLRSFQDFFNAFGRDQTCAMSLAIACNHSSIRTGTSDILPPHVVMMATKLFFELGGKPTIGQGHPVQTTGGGPLGVPLSTTEIRTSAKHNGLALYLGRLLRPIWKYHIVKVAGKDKSQYEAAYSVEKLVSVQLELQSLDRFLNQYKRFTAPPTPDNRPSGVDPDAWRFEQESLANMHDLLRHTNEAISFVSLLIDYRIPTIVAVLSESERKEILGMTFDAFVSTPKGRELGRLLMTSLVNKQIDKNMGVDVITSILQQRCPSICQANDVVLYKGMEILQSARSTSNPEQQESALQEAQRLFASVIASIPFEKLKDIVENYKSFRFFSGVIDLSLMYASLQEMVEEAPSSTELQMNNQAYFRRIDCYELIFNTFLTIESYPSQQIPGKRKVLPEEADAMKKTVLERALKSTDLFFHNCLYDWFIAQGRTDELLEIHSRYLEEYLVREQSSDLSKADLLWRLFVRQGRFSEAAQVLSQIAHSPGLKLLERLEYLTKAVANARSSGSATTATSGPGALDGVSGSTELLTDLTDSLDVARIQLEIFQILSKKSGVEDQLNDLDSVLFDINELFHQFAKPFRMHEIILLILHTSDQGAQGRAIVEASWTEIIRNCIEEAEQHHRPPFDSLSDKVKELGRRFYPNENVFNIRWLVDKLEQESLERAEKGSIDFDREWVVKTFRQVNVPFAKLFATYHELFEAKIPPWSTHKSLAFLIHDISLLLKMWLEHLRTTSTSTSTMQFYEQTTLDFPARIVDEALSKYLVTLSTESSRPLISALHQLQSRVRNVF